MKLIRCSGIRVAVTTVLAVFLVSCGGGSDSSSTTKPAAATASYSGNLDNAVFDQYAYEWLPNGFVLALHVPMEFVFDTIHPRSRNIEYREDRQGEVGGSVTITGQHRVNNEDWFLHEFNEYADGDIVIDGRYMQENAKGMFLIRPYDVPPATHHFYDLEVRGQQYAVRLNGTVKMEKLDNGWRFVSRLSGHDLMTGEDWYLEDVAVQATVRYHQGLRDIIKITGKAYHSRHGAVQLTTPGEFYFFFNEVNGEIGPEFGTMVARSASDEGEVIYFTQLNRFFASLDWLRSDDRITSRRIDTGNATLPGFVRKHEQPVAEAGLEVVNYLVGSEVTLNSRYSVSYTGKPLVFNWELLAVPFGSEAVLVDADTPFPRFTTDKIGTYHVKLEASDGERVHVDTVAVQASTITHWTNGFGGASLQTITDPASDTRVFYDARTWIPPMPPHHPTFFGTIATVPQNRHEDVRTMTAAGFETVELESHHGIVISHNGGGTPAVIATASRYEFYPRMRFASTIGGNQVFIRDVTGDGHEDIVSLSFNQFHEETRGLFIYAGNGEGRFAEGVQLDAGKAQGFAFGDLIPGGKDELAVLSRCDIFIYQQVDSANIFSLAASIPRDCDSYENVRSLVIADFDGDGILTLVTVENNQDQLRFAEFDANGTVVRNELIMFDYTIPGDWAGPNKATVTQVAAADMDIDGKLDIVLSNSIDRTTGGSGFTIFYQEDDSIFIQGESKNFSTNIGAAVRIGDFDGDGNDDIAAGMLGWLSIWLARPGMPEEVLDIAADSEGAIPDFDATHYVVADIDGSGRAKIFLPPSLSRSSDPEAATIVGIDTDGKAELFDFPVIATQGDEFWVYSLERGGWRGAAHDFNGDGQVDLLLPDGTGLQFLYMKEGYPVPGIE